MTHIRSPGLLDGVVIDVNNFVEIASDHFGDIAQLIVIETAIFNIKGKSNRGQVADRNLVWCCVFHDFSAKIRALNRPQILLVALAIARVFVQNIWISRFCLRLEDCEPKFLSFDCFSHPSLSLVSLKKLFEFFSPNI
jgi:hypothetical protein